MDTWQQQMNEVIADQRERVLQRPWLIWVGRDCPAAQRQRIDRRVPSAGWHMFGVSEEDARTLAMRFFADAGTAESALRDAQDDKAEGDALGAITIRYIAFVASGVYVGAVRIPMSAPAVPRLPTDA